MSFKQYRSIDLAAFIGMFALCEYLVVKAATTWFNEPYSISIMLPLLLIVMMRWDKFALIHAVIYAILFVFYHKGNGSQYLIYLCGNLGFMLELFYVYRIGKEKIRSSFLYSAIYVISGFLLMEVFRGIASMVILKSSARIILQFIFTDMLCLVFAALVVIIAKRADGLFEDQKHYLLRLNQTNEDLDGGWQDE
ncbi:MAG: hypothetical protein II161_06330 [Erysipelotrichaceae bacterium]|nr:hypothetical protein [Erysipelotrichaceae bacterium]